MSARVSVIVPVHDVAGHVGACLASLAAQTLRAFEVIVIDDGSTDGSGVVARNTVGGDARFRIYSQPNAGLSAARNAGLARATAPYVAFVDSDDRVAPTYLQRLVETLEETGADWVSCGIAFHPADAAPWAHSAIHGAWRIPEGAAPERHDFTDWREVVRHFPSAWNKLYRRALIGDIRFDEGMLYEDHAFYWRYAAKTHHLLRLPEPLYLSTQGRQGQITRDGSDTVFQQFDVLDILDAVSADSPKTGRAEALARIGTRLSFERAEAVRDRTRRVRFLARARDWLGARGLAPDPALGVPEWWAEALRGEIPVSVVVPTNGAEAPLAATLQSLDAQTLREAEVLVVPDERSVGAARARVFALAGQGEAVSVLAGAQGVDAARMRGLASARGRTVVFLDAGDTLPPGALAAWHERLRGAGADLGFARMRLGEAETLHPGLHDRKALDAGMLAAKEGFEPDPLDALVIHGHPSAKIFDTGFLRREGVAFPGGALSTTHMLARALARAKRVVAIPAPPVRLGLAAEARRLWQAATPAGDLRAALAAMEADPSLFLPDGWAVRFWARLVWEKLNHAELGEGAAAFEADVARLSDGLTQPGAAGLDPYIGPRVRRVIGLTGG